VRFKEDIDKVRERLYAFWEREIVDRACISVIAPNKKSVPISMFHNPNDLTKDPQALRQYWENPQTIHKNNIVRLEGTFLGGEALPVIFQNYGTSGHCNYFGAQPIYGNDTIWFDPVWSSLEVADHSYNEDSLKKRLAIARYLTDNAKDDYFVGMPDNCGTIDAICHLYGTENVLMDMISCPKILKQAVDTVNIGWAKTNEMFYNISKEHNAGGVHAWMHLLAPGRLTHMQCDMSVMISEQLYEEFVIPELEQQMQWLEYSVYHFDGIEQLRHLPYILSLEKLKTIQWTYVAGQPSAAYYIPALKQIQKAGKSLIIMAPACDIPVLLDELSAKGLYIHTETQTADQAKEIIAYTAKHSRERV
jgi:hypothetical protein